MQRNSWFHPKGTAAKLKWNKTVGSTQTVQQLNSLQMQRNSWFQQKDTAAKLITNAKNSWFHPNGTAAKLTCNETTSKQESPYQLRRNDSVESAYNDTDVKSSETMVCRLAGLLCLTPSSMPPKGYWRRPKSQDLGERRDYNIPNATLSPPERRLHSGGQRRESF